MDLRAATIAKATTTHLRKLNTKRVKYDKYTKCYLYNDNLSYPYHNNGFHFANPITFHQQLQAISVTAATTKQTIPIRVNEIKTSNKTATYILLC